MSYELLISSIAEIHARTQAGAAGAVNRYLTLRNWFIGAYIVEFEQNGEDRASYGQQLLPRLARDLKGRGIPGCSAEMLGRTRVFYRTYPQLKEGGSSSSAPELGTFPASTDRTEIPSPAVTESNTAFPTPLDGPTLLRLSWSHLIELIRLEDPWKRAFYENECLRGSWSKRELQRQISSLLYERTGLSLDKQAVIERARRQASEARAQISELIRDPYVLEFVGLAEQARYTESDLETALLDHIQAFLLELGSGFCFEARQKRITVGNEHDYIDLVFYHRSCTKSSNSSSGTVRSGRGVSRQIDHNPAVRNLMLDGTSTLATTVGLANMPLSGFETMRTPRTTCNCGSRSNVKQTRARCRRDSSRECSQTLCSYCWLRMQCLLTLNLKRIAVLM